MLSRLTDSDLRFLVETVAPQRTDPDRVIELVRDKEDFLEQMLENPKLLDRLANDKEALVRVSPYMLFSVLLRQVRRELEKTGVVYEPESRGRRIPVFEAPAVIDLLAKPEAREYLVGLLCSFVRTNSGYVYWRERGTWHRRKFNDTDLDDMMALAGMVDPELRPRYLKRVADIALFLSGIFPDRALRVTTRSRPFFTAERTLQDYEQTGHQFYALAAREMPEARLRPLLETLSEKFTLARSALNSLSDRYLKYHRSHYFELPN
jgi:hypothetical protein